MTLKAGWCELPGDAPRTPNYTPTEKGQKKRKRWLDRGRVTRWGLRSLPAIDPNDPLADLETDYRK